MIAVLVPVLNRPERAFPLLASLASNSTDLVQRVMFFSNKSDEAQMRACGDAIQQVGMSGSSATAVPWEPGPGDYAMKINKGYALAAPQPYVLLAADDLAFHPGWDEELIRVAEDTGAGVIGTNDLGNPTVKAGKHSTHPLVSRAYIDARGGTLDQEPGVVLYEGYGHQNCDTELVTLAKARKQWAFAADSHVEHLHPFWKKGEMDDVYRKGQQTSKADSRLYNQRLRMLRKTDP